jgi:hypothetical protein
MDKMKPSKICYTRLIKKDYMEILNTFPLQKKRVDADLLVPLMFIKFLECFTSLHWVIFIFDDPEKAMDTVEYMSHTMQSILLIELTVFHLDCYIRDLKTLWIIPL